MSRSRFRAAAVAAFAWLLVAVAVPAQFVGLQRCRHALPCSAPMAVRYNPDPLISGQYGETSSTAVSGRIEIRKDPKVELDQPQRGLSRDPSEEAARRFLLQHPPPARRSPAVKPTATPRRR